MSDPQTTVPADEAPQRLDTPTAYFDLEPLSGLSIRGDDIQGEIWLSWEETQQLAEFLRRHVGS